MTKHKHTHDVGRGMKAVQHGGQQRIGPMTNARHPRKLKLTQAKSQAPGILDKKTAAGAPNTNDGRAEQTFDQA